MLNIKRLLFLAIALLIPISSCTYKEDITIDESNIKIYESGYHYSSIPKKRMLDEYGKVDTLNELVNTKVDIKVELMDVASIPHNSLVLFASNSNIKVVKQKPYVLKLYNETRCIFTYSVSFVDVGDSVLTLKGLGLDIGFNINIYDQEELNYKIITKSFYTSTYVLGSSPILLGDYNSLVIKDYDEYQRSPTRIDNFFNVANIELYEKDFVDYCLVGVRIATKEGVSTSIKSIHPLIEGDQWEIGLVVSSSLEAGKIETTLVYEEIGLLVNKCLLEDNHYFDSIMRPVRITLEN